jgi:hypothetical protein
MIDGNPIMRGGTTLNDSKKNESRFWLRWYKSGAISHTGWQPCNHEVFTKGEPIALLSGATKDLEPFIKAIARAANAQVDWHFSGGIAQVLHLGDAQSRERVEKAIDELLPFAGSKILVFSRHPGGGIYRAGVIDVPENALAVYHEPDAGNQFMVASDQ